MLDAGIKTQLIAYLKKIERPVKITSNLDDGKTSQDIRTFLWELASLSDKITLTEQKDASKRIPSFNLTNDNGGEGVTFAGLPMGHEFTSLVLALLQMGGYPPKVPDAVAAQIRALPGKMHFETYISLSCHNCPDVIQALNAMSAINPNISSVMIDGVLFQDEVNSRKVMAVPTIWLNGEHFGQGRMTVEEILAKVDVGAQERETEELAKKPPYDMLIIGGGPAGSAAAVYSARKGIKTGIVAERFGGQILDTLGIDNLISIKKTEGRKLAADLEENVRSLGAEIINLQRAEKISRKNGMIEISLASGATLKSKTVVLAPGARWRELQIPGEREYRGRGVGYCPHCDGPMFKGKKVAVVGGGNSAVEAAIDLAGIVEHVTIIIRTDKFRADDILIEKMKALPNITIETFAQPKSIDGDDDKVTGITLLCGDDKKEKKISLSGVFVLIGLEPNTDWLKGAVELNQGGEIVVDSYGRTSMEGVFAAGDASSSPYKQIIVAMGDGAKASLSAFDYLIRH